jgi:hypothetical protein
MTGAAKANPSPVVRDHRGEPSVRPRPDYGKYGPCYRPRRGVIRDHRTITKGQIGLGGEIGSSER